MEQVWTIIALGSAVALAACLIVWGGPGASAGREQRKINKRWIAENRARLEEAGLMPPIGARPTRNEATAAFDKPPPAQISQADWDDAFADLRGLKKLAANAECERIEQNQRFASALDELERRLNSLVLAVEGFALKTETNSARISSAHDKAGALLEYSQTLHSRIYELEQAAEQLMSAQDVALGRIPPETPATSAAPTLADVAAAAPAPDIDEMRAYYAEKRAEQDNPERSGTAREATSDVEEAQPAARLSPEDEAASAEAAQ